MLTPTATISEHDLRRHDDPGCAAAGTRPLHVAIMSTQKKWHGGESQASLLAIGLRKRSHRVSVLARSGSEFATRMSQQNFDVFEFASRGRTPRSLWQIRTQLKTQDIDVLHLNDPHAVLSGGIASLGLNIPARIASRRVDFAIRSAAKYRRLTDAVICISNSVVDRCRASGIPDQRLHLVHDGVNPEIPKNGDGEPIRRELSINDDQTLLLTIASLTECKGHEYLIKAMPDVLKAYPNTCLALAGSGPLHQTLVELADRLGVSNHIRFLGYRNDVPDLLAAADLVVQPSIEEGLCSSLIDAMFSNTPIIATSAGGIPDLLDNRPQAEAAWLVQPRNISAMASAIRDAIQRSNERSSRAERAHDRAALHFTDDAMVDRTVAVYQSLLPDDPRLLVRGTTNVVLLGSSA